MLNRPQGRLGPQRQRGVGLIEVLIAVLVLSIGMLGMAGLQTWALRNNQSAQQRSTAVVQAYYIADAMRADRANALAGAFDIGIDDPAPTGTSFATTSRISWRQNLADTLGAGATGSVDCDGPICDVVVRWDDSRGAQGSVAAREASAKQTISIEVEL
ncbi:MAG: type IV pilus modification protein PilV [Steroidobacteraceae bacterium]